MGLVSHVFADKDFAADARSYARDLVQRASPRSIRVMKRRSTKTRPTPSSPPWKSPCAKCTRASTPRTFAKASSTFSRSATRASRAASRPRSCLRSGPFGSPAAALAVAGTRQPLAASPAGSGSCLRHPRPAISIDWSRLDTLGRQAQRPREKPTTCVGLTPDGAEAKRQAPRRVWKASRRGRPAPSARARRRAERPPGPRKAGSAGRSSREDPCRERLHRSA